MANTELGAIPTSTLNKNANGMKINKYTPKLTVECPSSKNTHTAIVNARDIEIILFQAITIEDFLVSTTLNIAIIEATEAEDNPIA